MSKSQLSFKKTVFYDLKRWYIYDVQGIPKKRIQITYAIIKFCLISRGFRSILFYRIINLKLKNKTVLRSFFLLFVYIFCLNIPYQAKIGEGLYITNHTTCIVINSSSILGKNVSIMQGVTIGGNMGKIKDGLIAPCIGNNVFIGAGAKILGPVKIGENSMIGANSVVLKDVPKDSLAAGVPAKTIKKIDLSFIEIQKKLRSQLIKK